jgi:hypothetical protein
MRFVVRIDEYFDAEISVERPGDFERSVHEITRRGHRVGLDSEFE